MPEPEPAQERQRPRGYYPPRRARNGHHPDCPYPREPAEPCAICAAIRKGDHRP